MWLEVSSTTLCRQHCWLYIQQPPLLLSFLKQHFVHVCRQPWASEECGQPQTWRVGSDWSTPNQDGPISLARDQVRNGHVKLAGVMQSLQWEASRNMIQNGRQPLSSSQSCPIWIQRTVQPQQGYSIIPKRVKQKHRKSTWVSNGDTELVHQLNLDPLLSLPAEAFVCRNWN